MLELVNPVIAVLAMVAFSGVGFLVSLPRREYAVLGLGLGLLLLGVSLPRAGRSRGLPPGPAQPREGRGR